VTRIILKVIYDQREIQPAKSKNLTVMQAKLRI